MPHWFLPSGSSLENSELVLHPNFLDGTPPDFGEPELTLPASAGECFYPYAKYGLSADDVRYARSQGKVLALDAVDLALEAEVRLMAGERLTYSLTEKLAIVKGMVATEWIYFVACVDAGLIKIGRTKNIKQRINSIRRSSPVPVEFICAVRFVRECEEWIHNIFSDLRSHGEWFNAAPRLLSAIRVARDQGTRSFLEDLHSKKLLTDSQLRITI